MQDSLTKTKSCESTLDLRNKRTMQTNEKPVAEISMKDFLDFLKISYQVNEEIEASCNDSADKNGVDWKKLTANDLLNRLKEQEGAFIEKKVGIKKGGTRNIRSKAVVCDEKVSIENKNFLEIQEKQSAEPCETTIGRKKSCESVSDSNGSVLRQSSLSSFEMKSSTEKERRQNSSRKKLTRKGESSADDTSSQFENTDDRTPSKVLKKKLNEILQEGILDSILPYLVPKQVQQENSHNAVKKLSNPHDVKKTTVYNAEKYSSVPGKDFKRKISAGNDLDTTFDKDLEVVIHVCDEIKNLKRDFKCSQRLLISQMGYFAEVTTGQKLEDMDISVHCDITIFDWLMRWVQRDNCNQKHWPILDSSIVISVLMSSAFLQMDSLQEYCLQFCKLHVNEIIRDSPNLSCINDNILTRLASLFSNVEIENINDKKDKIQSKLFCKLIVALSEPELRPHLGHFSSIATMYRCSKCLKLILKSMSALISCLPNNVTMDQNGCMHSTHYYDSTWNLADYVKELKADLKSWRKVYWRLWADCHWLFCHACEEYFPVHQMNWCRYHSELVQYFHLENQKSVTHPVGRYPCCGERAYRFELIKKASGCQYREHILNSKTTAETEIVRIWGLFKHIIESEPPPLLTKGKFIKSPSTDLRRSPRKEKFWWDGIKLVPTKRTPGLLCKIWESALRRDAFKTDDSVSDNRKSSVFKTMTNTESTNEISSFSDSSDESCSSSENSEESCRSAVKLVSKPKNSVTGQCIATNRLSLVRKERKKKKKKKKNMKVKINENRFWLSKLSTRSNQDNQRDFEERALKQIESYLAKKLSKESFRTNGNRNSYQIIPPGGIYVKLEQEWREAHCYSHGCPGSSLKARGSNSCTAVNNSFTLQKRSKSRGQRW